MKWTLLVPGALLPASVAPEMARAIEAPRLARRLASARSVVDPASVSLRESTEDAAASAPPTTPHWAWLARAFGADGTPPVTGPYAWQAGCMAEHSRVDPDAQRVSAGKMWVARCDPVHMNLARDHFVVTGLGNAPMHTADAQQLLALANEALRGTVPPDPAAPESAPALRLAARAGHWFLLAERRLNLRTTDLDCVLGQSVQDRLPTGADAQRWRVLSNEIQMRWHDCPVNRFREEAGQPAVNALWLHGGGYLLPLRGVPRVRLVAAPGSSEALTVRGWMIAARGGLDDTMDGPLERSPSRPEARPAAALRDGDTLAIHRDLFESFAHQTWETWLDQLIQLQERIEHDLDEAKRRGATDFELVLCGTRQSRTLRLPMHSSWWQRLRGAPRQTAALLQRWLAEAPAPRSAVGRVRAAAAATPPT